MHLLDQTKGGDEHPAVRAWVRMMGDTVTPGDVVVLKHEKRGSVYRLARIGSRNFSVIAKRAPREKAQIEQRIYEGILANLPLGSIRYHGSIEENDSSDTWLFLEDVGATRYKPAGRAHRRGACEWLGDLHLAVEARQARRHLEDRGPPFYYTHLLSIADAIPTLQARPFDFRGRLGCARHDRPSLPTTPGVLARSDRFL